MMINVIQTSHKCKVTVTIKKKIERNRCTHIWMHANVKAFWYNQLSTHYFLLINNNSLNDQNHYQTIMFEMFPHHIKSIFINWDTCEKMNPSGFAFHCPCDPQAPVTLRPCDPQATVTLRPLWPSRPCDPQALSRPWKAEDLWCL